MKNAIQKAIEGGWNGGVPVSILSVETVSANYYYQPIYLLDPLFWQALGKTEGWEYPKKYEIEDPMWKDYWHRFIDHLAEGKDADSFFNELLK